jgi:hypothetical protein
MGSCRAARRAACYRAHFRAGPARKAWGLYRARAVRRMHAPRLARARTDWARPSMTRLSGCTVPPIVLRAIGPIFVSGWPEKHGDSVVPVLSAARTLDGGCRPPAAAPAADAVPARHAAATPAGRCLRPPMLRQQATLPSRPLAAAHACAAAPARRSTAPTGRRLELGGVGRESTKRIREREKLRSVWELGF